MANKLTDMSKVRKVIQLHHQKKGKLFISKYLSLSRNTVKKYIALFQLLNLTIEDINQRSDAELEDLFSNNKSESLSPKLKAVYTFFSYHGKRAEENRSHQAIHVGRVLQVAS